MKDFCCREMKSYLDEGELSIAYWPKYREFGILYRSNSGSSIQVMRFCPWCGVRLPDSLRGEYYDMLERLGIDWDKEDVPADFKSDKWWKSNKGI
jgi:hypothetical protein